MRIATMPATNLRAAVRFSEPRPVLRYFDIRIPSTQLRHKNVRAIHEEPLLLSRH